MRKTELLTMYDYLAWLREQLIAAGGDLTTDRVHLGRCRHAQGPAGDPRPT